jgi:methylaspartate ammonia-lyase
MEELAPLLEGQTLTSFSQTMESFEDFRDREGKRLHTAIRYGLSQAVLDAVAKSQGLLMCELVAKEYGTRVSQTPIPLFAQTGDARQDNADKMIIKEVEVLPHALINNMEKLGAQGQGLADYLAWLRDRVLTHRRDETYKPVFHIDVYGTIGQWLGYDQPGAIADYLEKLADLAQPFDLRIEGPLDAGSREGQIHWLAELTRLVDERGIPVQLVADEWCNTYEDVKAFVDAGAGHMIQIKTPDLGSLHKTVQSTLYCKDKGVKAYQGGTCNETDRSAQVCLHVAMATSPDQILAKPGMGVDEGIMIAQNEMQRILALRAAR